MNTVALTQSTKSTQISEISAEQFLVEVEQFQGKVLIDFYAPWCAPCKMIAPVVEQVAREGLADAKPLKVIKINADDNQALMAKYGIRGIPTLMLINHGELVATQVGVASLSQVKAFIEQ